METSASEFVVAYYTSLVYRQADVPKFYDQETATIWRAELKSRSGVSFAEGSRFLIPEIRRGSAVTVFDFSVLALENGWALTVWGSITLGSQGSWFNQFFVLTEVNGRLFVVSDSLTLTDVSGGNSILNSSDSVVVPSGQAPVREARGRAQAAPAQPPAPVPAPVEALRPPPPSAAPANESRFTREPYRPNSNRRNDRRGDGDRNYDQNRDRQSGNSYRDRGGPRRRDLREPRESRGGGPDRFTWFPDAK